MTETVDSPYVHAASDETFPSLVLENSDAGPVLVNFWSKKAGPCLRQYPILDGLVHRYQGKFLLVNVDSDTEVKTTREYGIASVPTLKLFRNGKVVETLHGFQSEADLVRILDRHVSRDSDQALAMAIKEYSLGNRDKAYEIIADAIIKDPANPRLPHALCKLLIHEQRYEEADNLLASLPEKISKDNLIAQLRDQLSFIIIADKIIDPASLMDHVQKNPDNLDARIQLAAYYVTDKQFRKGIQELEGVMERDPHFGEDLPRIYLLKIFSMLGDEHELVQAYRPLLKRYRH